MGIVTEPNKYAAFVLGACAVASGCAMSRLGVLEPRKAFDTFTTSGFAAASVIGLVPGDDYVLASLAAAAYWGGPGGSSVHVQYTADSASREVLPYGGHLRAARARDRFFVNNALGVVVAEEASATARLAGLPQPTAVRYQSSASVTAGSGAVADGRDARYRATVKRVASDGYEIISAPSPSDFFSSDNGGGSDENPTVRVRWGVQPYVAGDIVQLWRTASVAAGTDPGGDYFLTSEAELASGDITAGYIDIVDVTSDDGLGEALYTNDEQKGATKAYLPPGRASDAVALGDQVLYLMRELPQQKTVRIPRKFGQLTADGDVTHGIGQRFPGTGTFVSGSPVVTGLTSTTGLVPGQWVFATQLPAGTIKIVSVDSASQITLDTNANANGSSTVTAWDVIEIDGSEITLTWGSPSPVETPATRPDLFAAGLAETGVDVVFDVNRPFDNLNTVEGITLLLRRTSGYDSAFGVRATNGQNYSPPLPEIDETAEDSTSDPRSNRVYHSEPGQPEAVPAVNYFDVGHGDHVRMLAAQDAVYYFGTDGLYRITGGGDDWFVELLDADIRLAHPDAADVMRDMVFAYTNRGLVSVDMGGVHDVSKGTIEFGAGGLAGLYVANLNADADSTVIVACDIRSDEVWVTFMPYTASSGTAPAEDDHETRIYNANTRAWTSLDGALVPFTAAAYHEGIEGMVIAQDAVHSTLSGLLAQPYLDTTIGYLLMSIELQPFASKEVSYEKEWQEISWRIGPMTNGVSGPGLDVTVGAVGDTYSEHINDSAVDQWFPTYPSRDTAVGHAIEPSFAVDEPHVLVSLLGVSLKWEKFAEEIGL